MNLHLVRAATVVALAFAAGPTRANNATHGCACIENQTPITINYEIKWGDNAYAKAGALPAGNLRNHCWKYLNPNDPTSPPLNIRYDYAVTTDGVQLRSHPLERARATNPQNCSQVPKSSHYHFRRTNNNTEIMLYKAQ